MMGWRVWSDRKRRNRRRARLERLEKSRSELIGVVWLHIRCCIHISASYCPNNTYDVKYSNIRISNDTVPSNAVGTAFLR